MNENDTIEFKLAQIVSLLTDIKDLLKEEKQLKESKLPRSI